MIKKIVVTFAIVMLYQGVAFAVTAVDLTTVTGVKFTPSNNVKVFYFSDQQNYTINAKHKAGDRKYSTSNKTSNIWYTTMTAGSDISAGDAPLTTTGAQGSDYTGWTAQ